jgi:hypothetical protein
MDRCCAGHPVLGVAREDKVRFAVGDQDDQGFRARTFPRYVLRPVDVDQAGVPYMEDGEVGLAEEDGVGADVGLVAASHRAEDRQLSDAVAPACGGGPLVATGAGRATGYVRRT